MSSVDYATARRAENRADCRYCGMSDDECTTRLLRRQNACCGSCYQTDTHMPAPKPKRDSLHEAIFWEHQSGPAKEPREWADWIVRLCAEKVMAWGGKYSGGSYDSAAKTLVESVFTIPEGRSTEDQ